MYKACYFTEYTHPTLNQGRKKKIKKNKKAIPIYREKEKR